MELKPYYRKAQFYETDQMGVVHHANYIHWMEEARVDYMQQIGFPYERCTMEHSLDLGLTDINVLYRGMVRFGQTVVIHVAVTALSPARMTVSYRMCEAESGAICFEGESVHFFYDRVHDKPVALKRVLPELYTLFENLCQKG